MFNEKNLKNATLMQDCENPKKFYLCAEQGHLKGVNYAYLFG